MAAPLVYFITAWGTVLGKLVLAQLVKKVRYARKLTYIMASLVWSNIFYIYGTKNAWQQSL